MMNEDDFTFFPRSSLIYSVWHPVKLFSPCNVSCQNVCVCVWEYKGRGFNVKIKHKKFKNTQTGTMLRCDNCSSAVSFWLMSVTQRIFLDQVIESLAWEPFREFFFFHGFILSLSNWMNLNWPLTAHLLDNLSWGEMHIFCPWLIYSTTLIRFCLN